MSVTDVTATNSNVPAWKRLGLKLKRDEAGTADGPTRAVGAADIRNEGTVTNKRSTDSENDLKRRKRRKTHSDVIPDSSAYASNSSLTPKRPNPRGDYVAQGHVREVPGSGAKLPKHIVFGAEESTEFRHHKSADSQDTSSVSRRKSVTFTPDTKREDGFSASNLFKSWTTQQNNESSIDPSLDTTEAIPPTPSKKDRKKQKSKDSSKKKNSLASKPLAPASTETPAYVDYLSQFHHDRANWKFNKNRQTDLLRHIFSLDHLPATLTPAIAAYMSGLAGTSARLRVHEEATEIMRALVSDPANQPTSTGAQEDDDVNMSNPEGRWAAYAAALQRQLERYDAAGGADRTEWTEEQLDEMRRTHERGVRAEAILRELLLDELDPGLPGGQRTGARSKVEVGSKAVNGEEAVAKSEKKNRKSRTEVSDSSSDSSSSDSTDSSDESEEEGGAKSEKKTSKPIFDKDLLDRKFGKKGQRKA